MGCRCCGVVEGENSLEDDEVEPPLLPPPLLPPPPLPPPPPRRLPSLLLPSIASGVSSSGLGLRHSMSRISETAALSARRLPALLCHDLSICCDALFSAEGSRGRIPAIDDVVHTAAKRSERGRMIRSR